MDTKALKNKILQLAIQGKLVAQDENDEPASVLLERIKEEKEQLIKNKVIKKEKTLPEIRDDEKLFNLPNGWEWCKFSDICNFKIGKTPQRSNIEYWSEGSIPWVSISDLIDGKVVTLTKEKITTKADSDVFKGNISKKGTLIMSFKLSIGKVSLLGMDAYHNEAIISIYPYFDCEDALKLYLFKILPSLDLVSDTKSAVKGSTLNSESIRNIMVPLPPIAEQKRIVAKVDSLFKLIDELDNNKEDLSQNISYVRNKVLQLAIQGKLVSQNENDEPASVLLKKIKEEKEQLIKDKVIRKEKPLAQIRYDEKSFEIPNGWEWCRLSQISNYIKAGGDKPKDFSTVKSEEYIIPVIANGKTNTGIMGYTKIATENNICITVSGRGTIGYSCIREEPFCPIVRLIVICPNSNINISYLHYVLQYLIEQGVGTSVQQLTVPMISPKVIPLPPLEEQKRIVAKVDDVMKYLDMLEKEIS